MPKNKGEPYRSKEETYRIIRKHFLVSLPHPIPYFMKLLGRSKSTVIHYLDELYEVHDVENELQFALFIGKKRLLWEIKNLPFEKIEEQIRSARENNLRERLKPPPQRALDLEILNALLAGKMTNQEIARAVRLMPGTVKQRIPHRIQKKVGIKGRVKIAVIAQRQDFYLMEKPQKKDEKKT